MQSRRMSALETMANLTVGIIISWLLGYFLLPYWGFEQTASAATTVTLVYTVASVIRSYTIRRVFNWL
jgi:uncharacterized membrane protein YbjE (DUF340 family)